MLVRIIIMLFLVFASLVDSREALAQRIVIDRNDPERVEWFQDLGFGMRINWTLDVQLGAMMSHSLGASSKPFQKRYFEELPKTFAPERFDPHAWARLAKLAGFQYVVFTAKHHNGFCMWDTKTSDFNVMNSGLEKDVLKLVLDAFRNQGLAVGISFSPDDYFEMYQQGLWPSGNSPESESTRNAQLWEMNKSQLQELLNDYGKIDLLHIDEKSDWANLLVANYVWDLDPDIIVTRGGMETFGNYIPEQPPQGPWEASILMGKHAQYIHGDVYKSSLHLIESLIETRAKGGNLLMNVGPNSQGEIPEEQAMLLREIGLWNLSNQEAISEVRTCPISKEGKTWFTQGKDGNSIYAFVNEYHWNWMEEKAFFFKTLSGSSKTQVEVLGQNNEMMEYHMQKSPAPVFSVVKEGIFVNVVKGQRFNKNWSNPLVIKLQQVEIKQERND